LALIADTKAFKSRLRGLHQALAAVSEGQAKLTADRAEFEQEAAKERAEIAAARDKVTKAEEAAQDKYDHVKEIVENFEAREQRISKLEDQWRFAEETDPLVLKGLRAPEHGPGISKARRAFGLDDHPSIDNEEPAVESHLSREFSDGTPFAPHTTVTRSGTRQPIFHNLHDD
jgi:phage shock protein A